jgi:hypothetical protein
LGLQRIKPGGTLIILLHKLETWHSMILVRFFSTFATVELFKPVKAHAIMSSFYMVAKNVQPQSTEAKLLWNSIGSCGTGRRLVGGGS